MFEIDSRMVLEVVTALVSCYSAFSNMKMKTEIMGLKLWIIQNFHAKDTADFSEK